MASTTNLAIAPHGPVGKGDYVVTQGDCIESIALKHGLFWQTIWDHPKNIELKNANRDANALLPGDRVFIPDIQIKNEPAATDTRHRYRKKGVPSKVRIVFKDEEDKPRAGIPYVLKFDGVLESGKTNSEGAVEYPIKPDASLGKLTLECEDGTEEYEVQLGFIDPVTEVSGIQERLVNLGFSGGPADGKLGPITQEALRAFQKAKGLKETGEPDQQTLQKLESDHTG